MATLMAKKAGTETPIATDDEHHEALASDPAVSAFPTGSSFGSVTTTQSTTSTTSFGGFGNATTPTTGSTSGASAFGAAGAGNLGIPGGGFGAPASVGSATSSFGSNSAVSGGTMPNANNVQVVHNQAESLKSGGGAMSEGGESTVALDKDATDWINKKMRPMMGWIYMLTCTCDFVIFPVLWSVLQALSHGQVTSQWQPLTLQGAGLYHIAMGAVLGIAAYGRTKEKVAGVAS
jgi:hypothetical protein